MDKQNEYKFICEKCGYEITVFAPELTEAKKRELHKCKGDNNERKD